MLSQLWGLIEFTINRMSLSSSVRVGGGAQAVDLQHGEQQADALAASKAAGATVPGAEGGVLLVALSTGIRYGFGIFPGDRLATMGLVTASSSGIMRSATGKTFCTSLARFG